MHSGDREGKGGKQEGGAAASRWFNEKHNRNSKLIANYALNEFHSAKLYLRQGQTEICG